MREERMTMGTVRPGLLYASDAVTLDGLDGIEARAIRVRVDTDSDSDRNDCGGADRRRFLAGDILRLCRLARALAALVPDGDGESDCHGEAGARG